MRTVARFNKNAKHLECELNKKNIFLGMMFTSILISSLIPNVMASSCSNASNWADSSSCRYGSMVAVIVTSHDPALESKLAAYDAQFGLPTCTVENGCLEIATPYGLSNSNPSANYDMFPFVAQVHQTSPGAKILVVEAKSISWYDKMDAVNYAKNLPEVKKVSSVSYSKVVMIVGLILK